MVLNVRSKLFRKTESSGCSYDFHENLEVPDWRLQKVYSFIVMREIN